MCKTGEILALRQTELRFYVPHRKKIGHFGDVLLSPLLGTVLKKNKSNTTKAHIHK